MSSPSKYTKAAALTALQALISGLQKHFANAQVTVANVVYATSALVTLLQSLESAMTAQTAAETAARDAQNALHATQTKVGPVLQALRELLLAQFGNATQTLSDFGLAPRKVRTPLTVQQKAAAKAKSDATRAARGTKGPKARLAITGTTTTAGTAPQAAPAVTPAAPVAPPVKSGS
jgi:hypothetical protein